MEMDSDLAIMPEDNNPFVSDSENTQNQDDGTADESTPSKEADDAGSKDSKRVEDTRQAIKQAQAEFHKLRAEKSEIEKTLAYLKGEAETIKSMRKEEKQVESKSWLDEDEFGESFNEDPAAGFRKGAKLMQSDIASLLKERDGYLLGEVRKLLDDTVSPEGQEIREAKSILSKQDWFNALPSDAQKEAAKAFKEYIPKKKGSSLNPPASMPNGTGVRVSSQKVVDEAKARADKLASAIWGNDQSNKNDSIIEIEMN